MKKILSIILALSMCISLCSCSCSHEATTPEQQQKADFSRTAGIWYQNGSPNFAKFEMDGAGAIISYYPEDGGVEFEGYIGYDAEDDCYAIYNDSDMFITNFTFDSDTQLHIGDDTGLVYVKSDEIPKTPVLSYDGEISFSPTTESDPDEDGGYYHTYLSEDKTISAVNTCSPLTIEDNEIIEQYIIKCISELCEDSISDVVIEENTEYTNKIGEHVYIISWKSKDMNWYSFFFNTNTHTYMYTLSSSNENLEVLNVFDELKLIEQ